MPRRSWVPWGATFLAGGLTLAGPWLQVRANRIVEGNGPVARVARLGLGGVFVRAVGHPSRFGLGIEQRPDRRESRLVRLSCLSPFC